jgi:putative tricarboxylic transport membrane protein
LTNLFSIWLFTVCIAGLGLDNCQFQPKSRAKTEIKPLECLAPAKPGGGYDLTCRLAAKSFGAARLIDKPMQVNYMPGGSGAVAYNHIVRDRNQDSNLIVAASTEVVLNLAQGKFGKQDENAVRWLAAIGADYGAIVVRSDAPWQNLDDMMQSLKKDSKSIVFGAGTPIGGQDWMKVALLAKSTEIDYQKMRFVPFESGDEAIGSLLGGHIQVYSGNAAEISSHLDDGHFRLLAVLSDERLPGVFAKYPTAKEQGYDVTWTVWRGYYLPPKVSEQQYQRWVDIMQNLVKTPEYKQELAKRGLFPFFKIGQDYSSYVKEQVKEFRQIAEHAGIK